MRPSPHAVRIDRPSARRHALCCSSAAPAPPQPTPGSAPPAIEWPEATGSSPRVRSRARARFCSSTARPRSCASARSPSRYPPQCGGPEIVGWDWDAVDLEESASGVTWGTYAVVGTWDGTTVHPHPARRSRSRSTTRCRSTRTRARIPANAGASTEDELLSIQDELTDGDERAARSRGRSSRSGPENGYLFVTVEYDDGTIQAYYDELYGPDTVAIQSALRDLE